jgi:hypothetical protein
MKTRKVKQAFLGYQCLGGGVVDKERVNEGEYSKGILYSYMKIHEIFGN